jgi:FtsH-binding integral membrane protein
MSAGIDSSSEEGGKASIMGALTLYLDFINLFLFLLRILGRRR